MEALGSRSSKPRLWLGLGEPHALGLASHQAPCRCCATAYVELLHCAFGRQPSERWWWSGWVVQGPAARNTGGPWLCRLVLVHSYCGPPLYLGAYLVPNTWTATPLPAPLTCDTPFIQARRPEPPQRDGCLFPVYCVDSTPDQRWRPA